MKTETGAEEVSFSAPPLPSLPEQAKEKAKLQRRENAQRRRRREVQLRQASARNGKKKNHNTKRTTADGKPKKGRPAFALAAETREDIENMYGCGLTDEQVRILTQIPRTTFEENRALFAECRDRGRALCEGDVLKSLHSQAAGGNLGAIRLYLERCCGWSPVTRLEHTGRDGSPIETKAVANVEETGARLQGFIDRVESVMHSPPSTPAGGG